MKNYTITVNGNTYNVTVEENGQGQTVAPVAAAPVAASAIAAPAASAPVAKSSSVGAGAVEISASLPGKVFKVVKSVGDSVSAGDSIVILEAMKMEVPVVAPQDGTVASIEVSVGDSVESGTLLATMN